MPTRHSGIPSMLERGAILLGALTLSLSLLLCRDLWRARPAAGLRATVSITVDDSVVLAGTVRDEFARSALVDEARRRFGGRHFVDRIRIDPATSGDWPSSLHGLLPREFGDGMRLRFDGTSVAVQGAAATPALRQAVSDSLQAALGPLVVVDNRLGVLPAVAP